MTRHSGHQPLDTDCLRMSWQASSDATRERQGAEDLTFLNDDLADDRSEKPAAAPSTASEGSRVDTKFQ